MEQNDKIQLFEDKRIRTAWDEEKEEWYFSIVDVVAVLTDQPDTRHASTYWAVLKNRLKEEGANELLTNCKQLKLRATDGKRRATDVADTQQLLRIIQSIPSPKAEPFKLWLAEATTTQLSKQRQPSTFQENLQTAREGGEVAGSARKDIEARSGGVPVITSQNAAQLNEVVTDMIEGVSVEQDDGTEPRSKN